jgi:hypothetical protein
MVNISSVFMLNSTEPIDDSCSIFRQLKKTVATSFSIDVTNGTDA